MSSNNHRTMKLSDEEEIILKALAIPSGMAVAIAMKTALDLDIFEHMAKAGLGAKLSPSKIASYLPTQNPEAPVVLDRMLRLLASQSYVECHVEVDEDGSDVRLYSMAPVCKAFVKNEDGVSLSPILVLELGKVLMEAWFHLKDAILDGGRPFNIAHGANIFGYQAIDNEFGETFNRGMSDHSTIVMKKALEAYNGFEELTQIIDVGGGDGTCMACIVSKYPNIKAINYDLPQVIDQARIHPGVEHLAGDMFKYVPQAESIFMKWILHGWSDEYCLELLKNCYKALPEVGKVIVIDSVLPEYPEGDVISTINHFNDIQMMIVSPSGKERTLKELQTMAKDAGFSSLKAVCPIYNQWIIEFYKN